MGAVMSKARSGGRACVVAAGILAVVASPFVSSTFATAGTSWPPSPGEAVAFQRVPAHAGVLYSRPAGDRCPLGFALGYVWDRSDPIDAELSGRYTVDAFGNSHFFAKTAGRRVTMVTPAGQLVRPKVLLHKGDRVCRRMDPQGNKPIVDPAGTIMGLPAGFPAHPTVDDVKALGLSTSTRTVPTFQVPQPGVARSRAKLPTAVTLGSVQSVTYLGSTPHVALNTDPAAPYGFSPDRHFDVTVTYRVTGGSGVLTVKPTAAQFTSDGASDAWEAAKAAWQQATGFTFVKPDGGQLICCDPPYEAVPLSSSGSSDLTLIYRAVTAAGVQLLADDSPRVLETGIGLQLGPLARGTFDDFGQEYLPISSTWGWSIAQDFGAFNPKVNAGCHPLTTSGDSCNVGPDGRYARDPASTGLAWIPVGVQ